MKILCYTWSLTDFGQQICATKLDISEPLKVKSKWPVKYRRILTFCNVANVFIDQNEN